MWKFFLACYTPFIFLTLNFLPLVFTQTLLLRKHNRIGCTVLASEPTDQFNFLFWETSNDIAKIHRAMACQHSHWWGYGNLRNTHKNSFLCQPSLLHSCFIAVWVQNKTTLKKMTFFPICFYLTEFHWFEHLHQVQAHRDKSVSSSGVQLHLSSESMQLSSITSPLLQSSDPASFNKPSNMSCKVHHSCLGGKIRVSLCKYFLLVSDTKVF